MCYEREFVEKLLDSDKWPYFDNPDFLDELIVIADDAIQKGALEGYLASVLIYHQACEEMVKLLLECEQFFIQCSIFPTESTKKNNDKKMFGPLLDEFKNGLKYDGKTEFIECCYKINKIRIDIVHKLPQKKSVQEVAESTIILKHQFDTATELFDEIYDWFRVCFHSFKKDGEWDEWIEELDETGDL